MTKSIDDSKSSIKSKRAIHFDEPPSIGFMFEYHGHQNELVGKIRILRRDGTPGWLLVWKREDGVAAASGLSSNGFSYPDWLAGIKV